MDYTLTRINENEVRMDIVDGAIMIPEAMKLAKKVAKNEGAKILKVCHNGVYLFDYFTRLNCFSIATAIEIK